MNFYASPAYLDTLASVYFAGKRTKIQDFEIDGRLFRFLVVGARRVITDWTFLDYSEPIETVEAVQPRKRNLLIKACALNSVPIEEWENSNLAATAMPAPYVNFSRFKSYADYRAHIHARGKERFKKNKRLRERLAEDFGELRFILHDTAPDVFDLSLAWKSEQLRETGLPDIFKKPENREFFNELQRRGHLRASTLRAKDRLLSAWLGFVHDGVWSGWIFTYDHDPALKKYSLGWQLMESVLEQCFESGLRGFDFSIGSSDYKFTYGTDVRIIRPFGTEPLVEHVVSQLKDNAKRALERFPRLQQGVRDFAKAARERF